MATKPQQHGYRYYDLVMAAFVAIVLESRWPREDFTGGISPLVRSPRRRGAVLSHLLFGDVLTEVYGYSLPGHQAVRRARLCLVRAIVVALPPAPARESERRNCFHRPADRTCLADRLCAGVRQFLRAGENENATGRWLWTRTIGSTIAGEGVDSLLFYPLAFYASGLIPNELLPKIMLTQFLAKVAVEVAFTPLTYRIVAALKRAEHEDYYDRNTDFNPFKVKP
jgi:hypothetical protein